MDPRLPLLRPLYALRFLGAVWVVACHFEALGLPAGFREALAAATPGGIAATTMEAMNRSGYEKSLSQGLRAGIKQARRNASY